MKTREEALNYALSFCGDLSGCPIPGSELAVSASKKVKKGVFVDI